MSDRQALFRAICNNPDDDQTRLVFADLLEEQGDVERAEFIRFQLRVAAADVMSWEERRDYNLRIRHIERKRRSEWLAELPAVPGVGYGGQFRRGFVETLDVEDVAALAAHAAELFTAAPIRCLFFPQGLSKKDAAVLAGVEELSRIRSLRFERYKRLPAESLRLLAESPYLAGVKELEPPDIELSKGLLRVVQRAPWRLEVLSMSSEYSVEIDPASLLSSPAVERLTELDLAYRHTGAATARAIAGNSRMTQLQRLILTGCDIGDTGAAALAGAAHLMSLRGLTLASNNITAKGTKALAAAAWFGGLRHLGLNHNPIGLAGLRALLAAPRLPELKELNLSDCKLDPPSIVTLAESPLLDHIEVLHVDCNDIGPQGVAALMGEGRLPNLVLLFATSTTPALPEAEVRRLKKRFGAKKVI
jgi:uncharacterized protein (TIGR02996 family)